MKAYGIFFTVEELDALKKVLESMDMNDNGIVKKTYDAAQAALAMATAREVLEAATKAYTEATEAYKEKSRPRTPIEGLDLIILK